ncbi:MAG: DUF6457 domain-containing protein [Actinomycetota bacterium]|nr:DUF6457 domain-containing protein [Actinomycetota bacterium]
MLDEWMTQLARELGVPYDVGNALLLDVARDAAHQVVRPAAPLTTFLVGYAAGLRGGGPDAVREAADIATRLAAEWGARTGIDPG